MYFAVPGRSTLHARSGCARRAVPVGDDPPGEWSYCRRCCPGVGTECSVCLCDPGPGERALVATCSRRHRVCPPCAERYAVLHASNPVWRGELRCPCGERESALPAEGLSLGARALCALAQARPPPDAAAAAAAAGGDAVDAVLDALTLRCPSCSQAFGDFDGCSVLTCHACGVHFCAWCFQDAGEWHSAHEHVRACPGNPKPGELYPTPEDWRTHVEEYQSGRLRAAAHGAARHGSWLYPLGLLCAVRARGVPVLRLLA